MTDKFKNTYRIPSARWREWDYGANGAYFVTVCTAHRERFFGEIADGEMTLSEIGRTAQAEWLKTTELRPDMNIILGEYVVMPNHFHAIIVIGENQYNTDDGNIAVPADAAVETRCIASLQCNAQSQWQSNRFAPQSKNLASIIRGFKSAVTKYAVMYRIPFAWQTRFHDRVIRDNDEHHRIAQYINANIENWQEDELHG
jgi:REP element-mobilizing transposase RayT